MKLLLVEDEAALRKVVVETLRQYGHLVEVAVSFAQARARIRLSQYDCVLLDLRLPDGDGLDLVNELRARAASTALLLLTACDSFSEWGPGLGLTVENYLPKPFHLSELNARIRAIAQRQQHLGQYHIVFRDLVAWPERHEVQVHGKLLTLTLMEHKLLLYLLANPDRVLTKEAITEHLYRGYDDTSDTSALIYTHFENLRKKLQEVGATDYIRTLYGIGYKLSTQ